MKKRLLSFITFSLCSILSALPGVNYLIPDVSGQYVFYEDKSFTRESYIGIVYYDDSTYGVRYYAPSFGKDNDYKPAKNIGILFTLDKNQDHVELTGERITTTITPDDTDLVNYLHDFLYEMTSRRQKAGDITKKEKISQDYAQFGGDVLIEYDPLVPITNLKNIEKDEKKVLEIVTAGQLASSSDTSFDDFKGIGQITSSSSKKLKIKKAKTVGFDFSNDKKTLSVNLDKNWEQKTENLWLLGNSSVLMINALPPLDKNNALQLRRRLLLSADHVYSDWRKLTLAEESGNLKIGQVFYDSNTDGFRTDCKILYENQANFFVSLTTKSEVYQANRKYFDNIIKSLFLK